MTLRLFIPRDAAALAVGAEEVAAGIRTSAARRNAAVDIVRTGSRGLLWLEPMVEVETPAGRIAYGPGKAADVVGLVPAGFLEGGEHPRGLGRPEEIPYLANQGRLTFERCGIVDPLSIE